MGNHCEPENTDRPGQRVNRRTLSQVTGRVGGRQERKQRTHQALLDAALRLVDDRGMASMSLREVAREAGIVPTAFYRHFVSMDELGVALTRQCIGTLRQLIRNARSTLTMRAVGESVRVLGRFVRDHSAELGFVARERYGGVAAVRAAIVGELRLFASELATDFARVPEFAAMNGEDLRIAGELMVSAMLNVVLELLDVPPNSSEEQQILDGATKQLRLIVLGMGAWRS
ncbi:MAG: TetR family transcriptional regulator [Sciscionella sp.]|nr:TetR family transcriptional regulator [Sciscionella sp.]